MRTVSLRRRVVAWSLGVVALLLLAVGFFVDANLGRQLHAEQRTRLLVLAVRGQALARQGVSDQVLADRLAAPGIAVTLTRPGAAPVVGFPRGATVRQVSSRRRPALARAAASAGIEVKVEGAALQVDEPLPGGRTLTLRADRLAVDSAQRRFRLLMLVGSGGGLALAGLALWWVLGRALAPLDVMTATARAIAAGDRGRRLAPRRTDTELGRVACAIDAMLEELEGAEHRAGLAREQLARFLSDASHELRTPIAGMSAGAEQLLVAELDPAAREQLTVDVVREARRAGRLVADLLTASQLEDVALVRTDVDVVALVAAAATRLERAGSGVEVEVVVDGTASDGPPLVVCGDPGRLEQVLANLLDNAARAGARVRLRVSRGGAQAVVVVSDSGPGVRHGDRQRIFERLVRLDDARTRSSGGAGLGLAIARGLARAHRGDLVCTDPAPADLPGGAFVLTLPLPAGHGLA